MPAMNAAVRFATRNALILCALGLGPVAWATPILYTIAGHGAGHLDGAAFDGNLVLELQSDTDRVLDCGPPTDCLFVFSPPAGSKAGSSRVTIDGIGVVNITEAVEIIMYPHNAETCLCIVVGPARTYASPQLFGLGNITGLDQYDMRSDFGPVATRPPNSFPVGVYLTTNHGNLDFSEYWGNGTVTFSATLVPLPGTAWTLLTGILAVAVRGRRRRNRD